MENTGLFRKTVLAGIGIYSLTKERAQLVVDDFVKRGEVSKDQSAKYVKALVDKSEEEVAYLKRFVDKRIASALDRVRPAYDEQFDRLNKKIDKLSREVERLRKTSA